MLHHTALTALQRWAGAGLHAVKSCSSSLFVVLIVVTLVGAAATTAAARVQPARRVLTGDQFAELVVESGIDATNVLVDGDVVLHSGDRVGHFVRCLDCVITGSVRASDVSFDRAVDLSGLRLRGSLDLSATTFEDVFFMPSASVQGPTDLALTTFVGRAKFDDTTFNNSFSATAMTSEGDFSLMDGRLLRGADFATVRFGDTSRFDRTVFSENVSFEGAQFAGPTSFQLSKFNETAYFFESAFDDTSDFTSARFSGTAVFDRTRFRDDATFRFVQGADSVSFREAQAVGELNLEAAFLRRGIALNVVSADTIVLEGTRIDQNGSLIMTPDYVRGLRMDVEMARHVVGEPTQIRVLEVLEETASADGDTSAANDARYTLLALSSQQHGFVVRALDTVFYRGLAGYLVRQRHPLVALFLLFLAASSIRTVLEYRMSHHDGATTWSARLAQVGTSARRGVAHSTPRVFTKSDETASAAAKLEVRAYAAILALLLIAVGNANPTVREVIDALQG